MDERPAEASTTISRSEGLNLTRWKGEHPFHEVYYLQWHDSAQQIAGWLRFTLRAPLNGEPVAQVWSIFFDARRPENNRVVKQTVPLNECRIERDFFYVGLGPSLIFQEGTRGQVKDENSEIRWDLKFVDDGPSLTHFPSLFYHLPFPKTKLTAPRFHTTLSGEWSVGGESWKLDRVPAHQAHFWGTEPATAWTWGHCDRFAEDPTACFEGLTAQVRLGPRQSPPLSLFFFIWKGELYSFNSPTSWFRNKSASHPDRWHFETMNSKKMFVGDLRAEPAEGVTLRYEGSNGGAQSCRATLTADLKIKIFSKTKTGWELEGALTSEKSSSFEVVSPQPLDL